MLGSSLVIIASVAFIIYIMSAGSPPPADPLMMPHVPSQTITELILLKPEVCIDPMFSKAMPDVLSVDSNFFHANPNAVVDPNFIRAVRVGDEFYQVYLMPDTIYQDLSKNY